MAKDFTSFSAKLKSVIDTLVSGDDSQPFAASYENAEPDPTDGWPALILNQLDGSGETRFSSFENMLKMDFEIRGIWPTDNSLTGMSEYYEALDKVLVALRTTANADTLDGEVDRFTIVSIDRIEQTEPIPIMGFSIVVTGEVRKALDT